MRGEKHGLQSGTLESSARVGARESSHPTNETAATITAVWTETVNRQTVNPDTWIARAGVLWRRNVYLLGKPEQMKSPDVRERSVPSPERTHTFFCCHAGGGCAL